MSKTSTKTQTPDTPETTPEPTGTKGGSHVCRKNLAEGGVLYTKGDEIQLTPARAKALGDLVATK
jgi:hypothetical protein